MVGGFIQRIESSVVNRKGRGMFEVFRNGTARCRMILQFEVAAAQPNVKQANSGRQRIEFEPRLRKSLHDVTNQYLKFFRHFHFSVFTFRNCSANRWSSSNREMMKSPLLLMEIRWRRVLTNQEPSSCTMMLSGWGEYMRPSNLRGGGSVF